MFLRRIVLLLLLGVAPLTQAQIPASERAVLDALYVSTGGAGWTNRTGWGGPAGTECSWYGVYCTGANVTGIILVANNLIGSLPNIGGLTALQYFGVSANQLTDSIPSLSGLTALVVFHVAANQLTGSIPSLSGLTSLGSFAVSDNRLTGPVPAPPASLYAGLSTLCNNSLVSSGIAAIDAAWNTATGTNWRECQRFAPSAPTNVSAVAGNGSMTVNFGPPLSDGGSAITGYTATCTSSNGGVAGSNTGGANAASIVVSGLTNGKSYVCTVTATNAVGTSVPSGALVGDPTQPVAPPPATQAAYTVSTGQMPAAAAATTATGTLGSATVTVTLDLAQVLTPGFFAREGSFAESGFNVYVAALVPGQQLGIAYAMWFVDDSSLSWQVLTSPIAAFLRGVAVGSADQRIVIDILQHNDITAFIGTEIYIGYGTSDIEMLSTGRYRGVYKVQ